MTQWQAFGVVACTILWTVCVAVYAHRIGYNQGWDERQREMILPPQRLERLNRDIDQQNDEHRHSAIDYRPVDPKRGVWH